MKPLSQGVRTSGAPMCVCAAGLVVRIRTSIRRRPPSRAFSRSNSNEYSQAATLARFLSFEFERHFAGSYRRSLSAVRIRTTLRRQLPSLAFCRSNSNDTSQTAAVARFLPFEFERHFADSYRRSFSAVRIRTTLRRQLPSLAFCRSNSNDTSQTATVARFSAVRIRTTLRRQLPSLVFCRSNSNDTSRAATVVRFLPFEFERHFAGSYRRSLSAVLIRTTLRGQLLSCAFEFLRHSATHTARHARKPILARGLNDFGSAESKPSRKREPLAGSLEYP